MGIFKTTAWLTRWYTNTNTNTNTGGGCSQSERFPPIRVSGDARPLWGTYHFHTSTYDHHDGDGDGDGDSDDRW